MGSVFRARHKTTGDVVAVKVASKRVAQHPTLSRRFRTDYEVANQLAHANLVRALDYGEHGGTPYLVMELVRGENLAQRLKTKGPLTEAEAVPIFVHVGQALQFLHDANILHRDIKPANILLPETGEAKLSDFGLGKDLDSDSVLTHSHFGLGTVEFAAPEQFEDAKHVDLRCDVYALGATLYTALAGQLPFGKGTMLRIMEKKAANQFTPLSKIVPTVNPAIDRLVGWAMQADPKLRPASCQEMVAELQGKMAEPSRAAMASVPQRIPERRRCVRYAVHLNSNCLELAAGAQWCDATVIDASIHGLCLQLGRRLEPKTILEVRLAMEGFDAGTGLAVQTHWFKQDTDGSWLVGCSFVTPLSESELERLLLHGSEPTLNNGLAP
jgi:serine/threonine protein kinase